MGALFVLHGTRKPGGTALKQRRLGRSDIEISAIGLGCWQFSEGSGLAGGFWEALPTQTVEEIVDASLRGGINWFDTAEAYGNGRSERALSNVPRPRDAWAGCPGRPNGCPEAVPGT